MKLLLITTTFNTAGTFQRRFGELSDEFSLMRGVSDSDSQGSTAYSPIGFSPGKESFFIDHNGSTDGSVFTLTNPNGSANFMMFHDKESSPSGDLGGWYTIEEFSALNSDHLPGAINMVSINNLVNSPMVKNARIVQVEKKFTTHKGVSFVSHHKLHVALLVEDDVTLSAKVMADEDTAFVGRTRSNGKREEIKSPSVPESYRKMVFKSSPVTVKDGDFASFLSGVQSMKIALEKA